MKQRYNASGGGNDYGSRTNIVSNSSFARERTGGSSFARFELPPATWNATRRDYPRNARIHELFEERALERPKAVAVAQRDCRWTYAELNRKADALAVELRRNGVGRDKPVGVFSERCPEAILGILATLKAGGAYVPLDPNNPPDLLQFILDEIDAPVVLTQAELEGRLPTHSGKTVRLNDRPEPDDAEVGERADRGPVGDPDDLAYVMFTSGTTGRPKGVMIPHRGVIRLLFGVDYVKLGRDEVVLHMAPPAFDASTFEIWAPLLHGGTCVLYPDPRPTLGGLGAVLAENKVTTLWLTSAFYNTVIDEIPEALAGVRQLLIGGEALSPAHVRRGLEKLPDTQIINGYGPTESTTFACCYRIPRTLDEGLGSIPIGRPIKNTRVYLLDEAMRPVSIGEAGELYIGGDGLARGYLGRPDLTAEKFVADPFDDNPRARLYRSGDLARYLADGRIEFLGRIDDQVKIHGFRIEPTGIDATIAMHPDVRQVLTLAREDVAGEKTLVSYLVPNPPELSTAAETDDLTAQWRTLYEDLYRRPDSETDPEFNIVGWNSSYTGAPIPAEEMREWVDSTVARILASKPRRVLEIGCGTGLLLFRVAPACERYHGTDFSAEAIETLRDALTRSERRWNHVELSRREAADFDGLEPGSFDVAVVNSVIQYFPDVHYLARVLEGAARMVAPGGRIFVGDVRSLPLLEAFHASVELERADAAMPIDRLRRLVRRQIDLDQELIVDPAFFEALTTRLPAGSTARVRPKRGRYRNEMNLFRYDCTIVVGGETRSASTPLRLDWRDTEIQADRIRAILEERSADLLEIVGIPDARPASAVKARDRLANPDGLSTVADLRRELGDVFGVDLEEWLNLADGTAYEADLFLLDSIADGRVAVSYRKRDAEGVDRTNVDPLRLGETPSKSVEIPKSWERFATNPARAKFARRLTAKVRGFVEERLPAYMVPSSFVVLDEFPLTSNGKVDRAALPRPNREAARSEIRFVPPSNPLETRLVQIWEEIFGFGPIGIRDDFFLMGGDSLLGIRLLMRVEQECGVRLPLSALIENWTVEGLAALIRNQTRSLERSTLVPIQTEGSRPPFFCLSGGTGVLDGRGSLSIRSLAALLGPDQPVYTFVCDDAQSESSSESLVGDLAARFVEDLRASHRGPYDLGGYSFGALVVLEMARRLVDLGETIGVVALLDIWGRDYPRKLSRWELERAHFDRWRRLSPGKRAAYPFVRLRSGLKNLFAKIAGSAVPIRKSSDDFEDQMDRIKAASETHLSVMKTYPGPTTLFRASVPPDFLGYDFDDPTNGAAALAETVDVIHVPGDHWTMLQEPDVFELAERIRAVLRERRHGSPTGGD